MYTVVTNNHLGLFLRSLRVNYPFHADDTQTCLVKMWMFIFSTQNLLYLLTDFVELVQ